MIVAAQPHYTESHIFPRRTTPTASEECAPWASKPSNKSVLVEAVAAKSDRRNDQGRDTENGSTAAATPPATPGSAGEKGSRGRTLSGVVDWALGRGNKINDDHFGAEEKGGPAEERTLLANHFRGRGNGGSGSGSGGESPVVGDARSRVAGSTISLFLEVRAWFSLGDTVGAVIDRLEVVEVRSASFNGEVLPLFVPKA